MAFECPDPRRYSSRSFSGRTSTAAEAHLPATAAAGAESLRVQGEEPGCVRVSGSAARIAAVADTAVGMLLPWRMDQQLPCRSGRVRTSLPPAAVALGRGTGTAVASVGGARCRMNAQSPELQQLEQQLPD